MRMHDSFGCRLCEVEAEVIRELLVGGEACYADVISVPTHLTSARACDPPQAPHRECTAAAVFIVLLSMATLFIRTAGQLLLQCP